MNLVGYWTESLSLVAQRQVSRMGLRSGYIILLCLLIAFAGMGYAQSGSSEQNLMGAWNVNIDFGGVIPACSAPTLNTRDGGIVANPCAANESPGYGQWVRTGNGEFALTFVGLEYDLAAPGGTANGTYKVRASVSLSNDSQEFSGPFQTDIFDLNGNLVLTVKGTVTAKRVVVEPL